MADGMSVSIMQTGLISFIHWNVSSLNAPFWNLVALCEKPRPHGGVKWKRNGTFSKVSCEFTTASQHQLPTRCRGPVS